MPKLYPKEFRDDVVAVARKGEAPLKQIAKDFGIEILSRPVDEQVSGGLPMVVG
ncbi:hypothetical protein [Gordonia polyisoprenivorans]|uniref:hypothetical protein n=1 Tax=Gordonia polyisoprenivorans TaxID=84595 RepID=UPI001FCC93B5|nr:hypothetical protein [Gordonia polyisoprenivorans]